MKQWIVIASVFSLLGSLALVTACDDARETDGDGDVDGDGDGDGDCDESWECCEDSDCSNGRFCDGIEICEAGSCRISPAPDCEDGLVCTEDRCDEASNLCIHAPNSELCIDDNLCNGEEICSPADPRADELTGCLAGFPVVCDDGDACTHDACVENECVATLRDDDGDSHGDSRCAICSPDDPLDCEQGDDCNDGDPDIFPGAEEVCDDGQDNNCDRIADYADPSCEVPNDRCESAISLATDVLVVSSTRGTSGDIDSTCAPESDFDVAFSFVLTEEQDVEVTVENRRLQDLTLALSTSCGEAAADLKCTTGQEFTQVNRSLASGEYFLVVSSTMETDFTIMLETFAPVPRPEGDQCETAIDVSEGGLFEGTTVGHDPDYEVSCSTPGALDAAFFIDVPQTTSAEIRADAGDVPLAISVQSACGIAVTERACFAGTPAEGWVRHLTAGRYYIVVQSLDEVDFSLYVTFMPTSADSCEEALDITPYLGGTILGTTMDMIADIETACGPSIGLDSTYLFSVAETQDVIVDFTSHGEPTTLSLTSACDRPDSELRCSVGETFQLVARETPPGTYYLVTTGSEGTDYELTVTLTDPAPGLENDLCSGALDVTSGGLLAGDTTGATDDYETSCGSPGSEDIAYSFELMESQSVDVILTAGSGPVSASIQSTCGVVGTEHVCLATDSTSHRFTRVLEAGLYYVVVETEAPDSFELELLFGDPQPAVVLPIVPSDDHSSVTFTGLPFTGQYNIDIAPLVFPFNGQTYDRVSVSVNGFIRFGNGSYPGASGSTDAQTDIDDVYPTQAQISWLGGEGMSGELVTYDIDVDAERVVITYIDHSRLGLFGVNDVQVILFCDTGDFQVSYYDCLFGTAGGAHWSIGVSEPFYSWGFLQGHDFTTHTLGAEERFEPGAIAQDPEHTGPEPYRTLNGRGISFSRQGPGWSVLVDDLP